MDFLSEIRKEPYFFLTQNRGKKYTIKGVVNHYEPYTDCIRINEKPDRIIVLFGIDTISSQYEKHQIPKGSTVTIKGQFSFCHWFEEDNLCPSFIKAELLNLELE